MEVRLKNLYFIEIIGFLLNLAQHFGTGTTYQIHEQSTLSRPEVHNALLDRATRDDDGMVREAALDALAPLADTDEAVKQLFDCVEMNNN
jgi:hypothetical protein